jgi:uncharacterized protein (TIGR02265 family)
MQTERLVFGHNFEGLYVRGLAGKMTPELLRLLDEEGVNLQKLAPAYPVEVWMRCLRRTADLLFPAKPKQLAHSELGRRFMRGYFETMMGKALLAMLKVLGPERTFKRMTQNFRTGNNFNEIKSEVPEPGHAEMWINHVLCDDPGFVQGLISEGLTLIAGREVVVTVRSVEGTAATFTARWKP